MSLKALVGLAVAVLAVSWGAPLARMTDAAPLAVAMWRMTLATLVLIPVVTARGGRRVGLRMPRATLLAGCFLGLHFGLWIPSLWLTSVSASVVLVATGPLFVLIASPRFLGVPVRRHDLVSFSLALLGVTIIAWGDFLVSPRAFLGDLMALSAAAAAAGYLVVGKRLRGELPLDQYLLVVYGVAALVLAAGVAALRVPALPRETLSWLPLLGMAMGPTLVGHTLLNWALAHLEAYHVSLGVLLEPVLATLWTWWLLAEAPPLRVVPGAVIVLGALVLEFLPRARGTGKRLEA